MKIYHGEYSLKVSVENLDGDVKSSFISWDEEKISSIIKELSPNKFCKGNVIKVEITPIDYLPCIAQSLSQNNPRFRGATGHFNASNLSIEKEK